MQEKRYRIFVLGAGFSRACGFPLAKELWREVRYRAKALEGRAGRFEEDLKGYLEYRLDCDGVVLEPEDVDFEEFMHFLDIEHFLGLRGSDTWSREGNEGTVVVKTLIGEILAGMTPAPDEIPDVYLQFARGLEPDDCVLTFNYDTLLETALEFVGKPYRLFPSRYKSVYRGGAIVDTSNPEVAVLKLHGSIDWFDRTEYSEREEDRRKHGLSGRPSHPVFARSEELGVRELLAGPRHGDDPLREMHRVRDVKRLYQRGILFEATPWLLAPSTMKILYADKLREFWYGSGRAGALNFGLAIIGYSLPVQDTYARQVLYSLATNYQRYKWEEGLGGLRKDPLVVVGKCGDAAEERALKERYQFVNWDRAVLYKDGLTSEVVDAVFRRRD